MPDDRVTDPAGTTPAVSRDIVMEALQRVVSSEPFVKSPRSRDFLAYVVTETVAGRGDRLKERTVARRALARSDDFDARADASVRVQAGRVRAALDAYYEGPGRDCAIRISLPKGTYVPTFTPMTGTDAAVRGDERAAARTRGPAVAVMELETADDGPRATALAHGMTDSLVRALSRFPGVRVVGPIARDDRPESPIDEQRLGVRLGVQYLVRGTMREMDDVVRVTTRLVDASTGEVVWSERVDTSAADLLHLGGEDEVAGRIAGVIGDYSGVLLRHAARQPDSSANPVVTEALLRYYEGLQLNTPAAGAAARAALELAIESEPGHPQLLAMLASTWTHEALLTSGDARDDAARRGEEYARAALAVDPVDPHAHLVLGTVHLTRRHLTSARHEALLAVDEAPGNPSILYGAGWILALVGEWDEGVAHVRESTRLNPSRPTLRYALLAVDRLTAEDFAGALVDATRVGAHDGFLGPLVRALALAGLGHRDEAATALGEARALEPGLGDVAAWWPDLPEHPRDVLVAAIDALTTE